ncbi:DUF3306 domain-containing protein [Microbaculum sp. FT89]|uniref:DUF3306 domain-containing protein n=1 Tax=Microbaculum sp. FT89 TaxID=3447298 RepID=UPI003F532E5F
MADDSGFLSRWSRRKLAEKEPAGPPEAEATADLVDDAGQALAAVPDAPSDTPCDAPPDERTEDPAGETAEQDRHPAEDIDIESLTKESDFTIFMQKGVTAATRRKALRKLWTSDPVLANLDGLNDYEDMEYTYGIGTAATSDWKLGRGFLSDKDLGLEPEPEETEEPLVGAEDAGTADGTVIAEADPDARAEDDAQVGDAPGEPDQEPDEDPKPA